MRKENLQEATQRALIEGYKNLRENKSKKTEAKLEDIQMEIYEMIQIARNLDKLDKDTNKRETAYAIMQEYPEINRKELINYISKKVDEIYAGDYDEKTESKKVEAKEDTTSSPDYLEKAFEVEVEYWLQALVDEDSNDEIGKKAQEVLDDKAKMKSIVDELVNGSDDLWEDIHRRIEELAGLHYRESSRVNESKKVIEGKDVKSIVKQVLNALNKYDEENVSVDEDEETGNISIMFTSSNNSFPIAKDVCNVKDINVSELVKELDNRGIGHCLLS